MNINSPISAQIFEVNSRSTLLDVMGTRGINSIILGADGEALRKFYVLDLSYGKNSLSLGIMSSDFGISPSWHITKSKIFLGFDNHIVILDLNNLKSKFTLTRTPFHQFLFQDGSEALFALFEADILCFNRSGELLLDLSTERIVDVRADGNEVNFEFDYGSPLRLSFDDPLFKVT